MKLFPLWTEARASLAAAVPAARVLREERLRSACWMAAVRAASVLYLALPLLACEEVTSAIRSSEGTEIPSSDALRRRAKLLVLSARTSDSQRIADDDAAVTETDASARPAATSGDAGSASAPDDEPDAEVVQPSTAVSLGCPVQISLQTVSYGNGDEGQDDYAPNNVGAIWITKPDGDQDVFVRTVVAWGPTYFDQALTWIDQTRGNLVDTVTLPTRPGHMRAVEASWDCRNTMQRLVAAGTYHVNFEFTEVESQGPVLTGEKALLLELGDKPFENVRAPEGLFGEVRVKAGPP